MVRVLILCVAVCFSVAFFTSCISEKDKKDILAMVSSDNALHASMSASSKQALSSSDTGSDSSESQESGSTKIDNKAVNDVSSGGSSSSVVSSGVSSSSSDGRRKWGNGEYGGGIDWGGSEPIVGDGGGYSSRNDLEFSAPSDWEKPYEGGTNPGLYPWEIDENIPDIKSPME